MSAQEIQRSVLTSTQLLPVDESSYIPMPVLGTVMTKIHHTDPEGYWGYLSALEKVQRWQTGDQPVKEFPGENVHQHTAAGMHILWLASLGFAEFSSLVNIQRAADYFFFHDGGEVATKDIANTDPKILQNPQALEAEKQKVLAERTGFIEQVLPLFTVSLRPVILNVFLEYEQRKTGKKFLAANTAKWVDIFTGNSVALEYFYPERNSFSAQRVKDIGIRKFLAQTARIYTDIKNVAATNAENTELQEFVDAAETQFLLLGKAHVSEIISRGYLREVFAYWDQYQRLLQQLGVRNAHTSYRPQQKTGQE